MRTKVIVLDIEDGLHDLTELSGYAAVRILVRHLGPPAGWLEIPCNGDRISAEKLQGEITLRLGMAFAAGLLAPEKISPSVSEFRPRVTVIVCTRNRAAMLEGCLTALNQLDYPDYQVLVVDNAPTDNSTFQTASRLGADYIREDRPGLDWARNAGCREAATDIVAYIDDDARPDSQWLTRLVQPFQRPEISAVTGLVIPAELETEAQLLFERYGGMGHGLHRRLFHKADMTQLELFWSSACGVGTNMAFRRQSLLDVGLFDPALDVGTASHGGGDIEMYHRLLAQGHRIIYEPSAIVRHYHRRDLAALKRQIADNGRGFGCYLLTCLRHGSLSRQQLALFLGFQWAAGWIGKRMVKPRGLPRSLVLAELLGMLYSPLAYRSSRRTAAKLARRTSNTKELTRA